MQTTKSWCATCNNKVLVLNAQRQSPGVQRTTTKSWCSTRNNKVLVLNAQQISCATTKVPCNNKILCNKVLVLNAQQQKSHVTTKSCITTKVLHNDKVLVLNMHQAHDPYISTTIWMRTQR
jgi:hypothetical protein